MASDKLLHDPQWMDHDIKWYISSKPVKRILGKSGTAPAGTIFQVDYEASQLDEKLKKEIVLKSCHKGVWKVKWAPQTFYGLDVDSKDLLLALPDQNDRLRFYLGNIKYPTNDVEKLVHTSGRETATQTPMKRILSSTQQQMQNDLNKNSQTSPVITRPPSTPEMDYHDDYYHIESSTEHYPATQSGRKQEEQKKKTHTVQARGLISSIAASLTFKSVEQPSFPLDDWHLGQITIGGNDLLRKLAYDLQIKDADEIFRRGKDIFGVTSWLLKHWWEQLNEGHKAAFRELKDSLKRNGFGELVYYLENGDPTDGCFHPSIIEIVEYKFGSRLPQLADKLGVPVTADLPLSVLAERVFDVWQKHHPGIEKLSQLVHVIKEISKEIAKTEKKEQESLMKSAELKDLALELEQGLSESVVKSISSSVPRKEWYELGYSLGLSQLRLNAMERKFFSLSNRVFHVLRYWQMIQPYEVDQAEKLIVALQSCGLQENIHIISKGLDEERLMRVAECIGDNWKIFAGIVFGPRGIQHLMDSTARDQDKALSALRKWKRKQPATCKDLKKKLYEDLKEYKLLKAAKMVFDDSTSRSPEEEIASTKEIAKEEERQKLREMEAKLEEELKQKKLEGDLEDLAASVKNANKAKEESVRQQRRVQQITDKLMAEHGISRAEVDTVLSLREEHELSECIEAMKAVGSNLQRAWDYFKECDTCFTKFGMHKLLTLPLCQCRLCTECVSGHFTVLAQTMSCMDRFVCPACNEPDLKHCTAEQYEAHFSLLSGMGCGAGFINERVGVQKVQCPECKEYQCFDCMKLWLDQHDNISCEEFDAWKRSNDPEFQQQGLAAHLKENGINCPKCKMRYELAKGGCMHFKCPQCHHEFCCGCNLPFRSHPACNLLRSCIGKGLHAHHPRDCFYYLRDEECHDLQQLLQKHGIDYSRPTNAADAGNGEGPQVCPVKEQQETPDGLVDAICGKPLKDQCGLCENHYKEYLVGLINQNSIDPVDIFGVDSLQAALRRNDKRIPNRVPNEADAAYCARLRQEVQLQLLLRPVIAQAVQSVAAAPFWQR